MDAEVSHLKDLFPYDLDYITDELKKLAKSELFEDEKTRTDNLELLRSMLRGEANLYWKDDDLFLLAFLRARKFNVKNAFLLVKNFYTTLAKYEDLNCSCNLEDIKITMEANCLNFLSYRDYEGCVVMLVRCEAWDPSVIALERILFLGTVGVLHALLYPATHIAGFKLIIDGKVNFKHLMHIRPFHLKLAANSLQKCLPGRFREIHSVNENVLFSMFWNALKPFLSKKLKERVYFHGKAVKNLHKHFPASILPIEYDGEQPPANSSEWAKRIENSADYINHVFSFGYGKSRQNKDDSQK